MTASRAVEKFSAGAKETGENRERDRGHGCKLQRALRRVGRKNTEEGLVPLFLMFPRVYRYFLDNFLSQSAFPL